MDDADNTSSEYELFRKKSVLHDEQQRQQWELSIEQHVQQDLQKQQNRLRQQQQHDADTKQFWQRKYQLQFRRQQRQEQLKQEQQRPHSMAIRALKKMFLCLKRPVPFFLLPRHILFIYKFTFN